MRVVVHWIGKWIEHNITARLDPSSLLSPAHVWWAISILVLAYGDKIGKIICSSFHSSSKVYHLLPWEPLDPELHVFISVELSRAACDSLVTKQLVCTRRMHYAWHILHLYFSYHKKLLFASRNVVSVHYNHDLPWWTTGQSWRQDDLIHTWSVDLSHLLSMILHLGSVEDWDLCALIQ